MSLISLMLSVALTSGAHAASLHVQCGESIVAAVDSLVGPGPHRVTVESGCVYRESSQLVLTNRRITIAGDGPGPRDTTWYFVGAEQAFVKVEDLSALRLLNITLDGSIPPEEGAPTENICRFSNQFRRGISVEDGTVEVVDSEIRCMFATTNGAGIEGTDAEIVVEQTRFFANIATESGGHVSCTNGSFTSTDTEYVYGLAADGSGGAVSLTRVAGISTHDMFAFNQSGVLGGALSITMGNSSEVAFSDFVGNAASDGGAVAITGDDTAASHRLHHNLFVDNDAGASGGAVFASHIIGRPVSGPEVIVVANNFVSNSGLFGAGLAMFGEAKGTVVNNIFAHHQGGPAATREPSPGPTDHNLWFANAGGDTSSGATGPGAVHADPLWVAFSDDEDATNDVFTLQPGSPAIDAGRPGYRDQDGSIADIGMTGGL